MYFAVNLLFVIFPNKSFIPEFLTNAWDFGLDLIAKILYLMPSGIQTMFLGGLQFALSMGTVILFFLIGRNIWKMIRG